MRKYFEFQLQIVVVLNLNDDSKILNLFIDRLQSSNVERDNIL